MDFSFSLICTSNKSVDRTVLLLTLHTLDLGKAYREHRLNPNSFEIGPLQDKDTAQAAQEILSEQGFRCSVISQL